MVYGGKEQGTSQRVPIVKLRGLEIHPINQCM